MGILEAIVLGCVQGVTEFLPISSTAHVRIVPELFGWRDPGAPFTAAIQLGTLLAIMLYFGRDIVRALAGWAGSLLSAEQRRSTEARMGWAIVIGSGPIVVCGLLFQDAIESSLRSLYVVSASLIAVGLLMAGAERLGRKDRREASVIWLDGLVVGLFQALALIPGVSRSGSTMSGSLLLGFAREDAARFSFLLSVPSILGAGVYSIWKHREALLGPEQTAIWVANGVSFVTGIISIALLLRFLRRHGFAVFVAYRLVLGAAILVAIQRGALTP